MRRITRTLVAFMIAAGVALTLGMASAQAAEPIQDDQPFPDAKQAESAQGCPSGAVCIYPENAQWNGGHPSHVFESYGAHNLSGQVGRHFVYNNQVNGATARTCTGFDGAGDCQGYLPAGHYLEKDLTPINSVVLVQ